MIKDLLVILIASSLVNNVVLSQFLGLCPFLGVSKKTNTATGMGVAVIFVITLASAVAGAIYQFILVPFDITYLQTIVFILVIAALVQFVEMFLKVYSDSLSVVGGVSSSDYHQLRSTGCGTYECAEKLRNTDWDSQWFCNSGRLYHFHCNPCRYPGENGT